jgi:transcriptional regulator with XRE-family HTH domain
MPAFRSDRCVELREQLKLTQDDIAGKIGVSKKQVSAWETGSAEPRTDSLIALARLFSVSTDYLLGVTDDPNRGGSEISAEDRRILAIFRQLPQDIHDFILRQTFKK